MIRDEAKGLREIRDDPEDLIADRLAVAWLRIFEDQATQNETAESGEASDTSA